MTANVSAVWLQRVKPVLIVAAFLLALAIFDWLFPVPAIQTALEHSFPDALRWCVSFSFETGPEGSSGMRAYLLLPQSFIQGKVFFVGYSTGSEASVTSSSLMFWGLAASFAYFIASAVIHPAREQYINQQV